MTRIEQLKREASIIQDFLEVNAGGYDIDALMIRLDQLGVYYARSGAMHAEVLGLKGSKIAEWQNANKELLISLAPSIVKDLMKGATAEYDAFENHLDRINAACSKQCDNLRTLISYEKQRAQLL